MRRAVLLLGFAMGCGSETGATGAVDASDASDGAAIDAADASGNSDTSVVDGIVAETTDASGGDADASTCGTSGTCHAYWCKCGRCNPVEITCIPEKKECLIDCVQECPELATTKCACEGSACKKL